ncbi:sulfotransferase family 2 domain-containing protein [Paraglaciecola sp.]|uniref:sulfotransferase family 2 domain-containing protein n=1 Tax=Paraglaciecola sp. TaxID=1920173 RepID=UPI003EF8CEF0
MNKSANPLKKLYRNTLPQLIQQKIDVLRGESQVFRPCFQETKSIFIHIPKAAGTSIARAIYGMNVGHRKAVDYQKISKNEYSKYFTYSFVRNPWDRVVSAYNFARQSGTKYVQPIPNPIYQSELFNDFETFITQWLPSADLSKEDVVFAPQYWYIYDKNMNCLIDYIGRIETLDLDLKELEKKLDIEITIEQLNKSNRAKSYREYFNDDTKKIVEKVYQKDIELFQYEF